MRLSAHALTPPPWKERILCAIPIPVTETESALPVVVYTTEFMQKNGANTPIEGLRQLPFFVGTTQTENDSNGGDGSAFINLYGLGANNVLTLINGRRAFAFSDINAIPIAALSRTEIFGGNAYGSDSTGGVVNLIMLNGPGERPYEGAELHALYGNTTDADAHVRQVYVGGGVTGLDGKVSIAAAGEYYSRAGLFSRDREISSSGDRSNNPTGLGLGGTNNNSPTFGGRVTILNAGSSLGGGGVPTGTLILTNLSNNQVTPFSYRRFEQGAGTAGTDPSRFNFRAFTPAIPAMEKAMYFVTGRYKIFGDGLQLYGDIMYSKVKQDNAISSSPFALSSATNGRDEARASSFNPFGNNLSSISYRLQQELGNRRSFFDKDYYRYVVGINGDFDIKDNEFISRFAYDSGFVYERLNYQREDSGDARRSYLRALIAPIGFVNNVAPLPRLPSGIFNPFIGINAPVTGTAPIYNNTNSATPNFQNGVPIGSAPYDNRIAANDWTSTDPLGRANGAAYVSHSLFYERDCLVDVKVNGHLFPNLWNGGLDFAAGFEKRDINQKQIPDPVQASGDQLGFSQLATFKFREEVDAWFIEVGFPLVTNAMGVPFIRSLDLDFQWRREEFSDTNLLSGPFSPQQTSASYVNENPEENFGGSPSVSLRYQPIPDLLLRASWRQSVRPPTFTELFRPIVQNFPVLFGIGGGDPPPPPNGIWDGGNPALQPETTDSYSVGVVWTPKFVPGFTITMDAYQMFTTNVILEPDSFAQVLIDRNVLDPDGCGLGLFPGGGPGIGVTRINPADPMSRIDCIDSGFGNAGKRLVQGVEATAAYELPTEHWGKFTFSGGYNHFFTWKAQPGTGPFNSFLGNYNNGTLPLAPGAIPWNKGFLRGEWEWRHFDFVATGNYIGDFRDDPAFDDFRLPTRPERRNVPSYITLDMQLSYEFVKPEAASTYSKDAKDGKNMMQAALEPASIWQRLLWGTTLTVGVNNAFDRNPPTVLAAFNDNYDTSLHTIRNRYYYVALTKKF